MHTLNNRNFFGPTWKHTQRTDVYSSAIAFSRAGQKVSATPQHMHQRLTVFLSTPVGAVTPSTVHSEVHVIEHGVFQNEGNGGRNLSGLGYSVGEDAGSFNLLYEIGLHRVSNQGWHHTRRYSRDGQRG